MSGHSHWAGIKHRKGINDAKRAALFTKYGRNIIVAASRGDSNPDTNFALRLAIDQARAIDMPKENIERAIRRSTGELKEGVAIEEYTYEAYGPGNAALLIETATDNKNRTVSEIKGLLAKGGGKFVPLGSVSFMFRRVSFITFDLAQHQKEKLESETLESGADDFLVKGNFFIVVTRSEQLQKVQAYFTHKGLVSESAELGYLPYQTVTITENERLALEKLRETLDNHQDVLRVWDNLQ